MAQSTFQVSDDINIDGKIISLSGATSGQALVYSTSTSTFTPTTITPVGTVVMYGGATAPTGWLACDGTVYNISTYTALGALLTSKYGGNGTTTFAVPNFNGRIPVAMNSATTTPPTTLVSATDTFNHSHTANYGATGLAVSLMHSHNASGTPSQQHGHTLNSDKGNHAHSTLTSAGSHSHNFAYKHTGSGTQQTSFSDNSHTHGFNTDNANHYHNAAGITANHTHGGTYDAAIDHNHTHTAITLNTNAQTTSISNHSHSGATAIRALFIIKT